MIGVFIVKLSEIYDMEELLIQCADSTRREKAARFLHKEDRLRCLAAGYLMKHFVPGFSDDLLRFGTQGKPFLENGVPFSISHGGDHVVLAVCEECRGIGVDAEPVREMEYYKDMLPFMMNEAERGFVGGDAHRAVRIWTRKESLYKSVGEGISDVRELPDVREDRVVFAGDVFLLRSMEEDGHSLSIAVHGVGTMPEHTIRYVRIRDDI